MGLNGISAMYSYAADVSSNANHILQGRLPQSLFRWWASTHTASIDHRDGTYERKHQSRGHAVYYGKGTYGSLKVCFLNQLLVFIGGNPSNVILLGKISFLSIFTTSATPSVLPGIIRLTIVRLEVAFVLMTYTVLSVPRIRKVELSRLSRVNDRTVLADRSGSGASKSTRVS